MQERESEKVICVSFNSWLISPIIVNWCKITTFNIINISATSMEVGDSKWDHPHMKGFMLKREKAKNTLQCFLLYCKNLLWFINIDCMRYQSNFSVPPPFLFLFPLQCPLLPRPPLCLWPSTRFWSCMHGSHPSRRRSRASGGKN